MHEAKREDDSERTKKKTEGDEEKEQQAKKNKNSRCGKSWTMQEHLQMETTGRASIDISKQNKHTYRSSSKP
jgi:hypothetical protein